MKRFTTIFILALMTMGLSAQTWSDLFTEDFDDGAADVRWTVVDDAGPNSSDFAYDYIAGGIAAAPGGGGLGLKFEANLGEGDPLVGVGSSIYAFPLGQSFTGEYKVSFDLYMSFEGETGSTEFGLFGVMHTDEVLPSANGIDYAVTCDNGSARDIRVYEDGVELSALDFEGGYLLDGDGIPTQNNNTEDPYNVLLGTDNPGNQWLSVSIEVKADSVLWLVNGYVWSAIEKTPVDGNIAIAYADWFSSLSESFNFAIYDNVKVQKDITGIEEMSISKISLYPNPVSDLLNVVVKERSTLELINSIGQTVYRSTVEGTSTVELSDVKSGIYFAKITSESGKVEVQKIMVK